MPSSSTASGRGCGAAAASLPVSPLLAGDLLTMFPETGHVPATELGREQTPRPSKPGASPPAASDPHTVKIVNVFHFKQELNLEILWFHGASFPTLSWSYPSALQIPLLSLLVKTWLSSPSWKQDEPRGTKVAIGSVLLWFQHSPSFQDSRGNRRFWMLDVGRNQCHWSHGCAASSYTTHRLEFLLAQRID